MKTKIQSHLTSSRMIQYYSAALAPNATTCELAKSFEGTCCPASGQNPTPPTTTNPPISTPPPTPAAVENPTPAPVGSGDNGGDDKEAVSGSSITRMMAALNLCALLTTVVLL